jgi:hypothetical protein
MWESALSVTCAILVRMLIGGAVVEKSHWMSERRLKVYPPLFMLVGVMAATVQVIQLHIMVDPSHTVSGDFLTFYGAAKMAAAGHATWAYDIPRMLASERAIIPAAKLTPWFYPPSFFFVVLPLAAMPLFVAYVAFTGLTLAIYVKVFRAVTNHPLALWSLAVFPGLWINLLDGQNAFLTAALAAGACLLLARRPLVAGVLIGCLVAMKPHLALLFPLVLAAIQGWRALVSAFVTAMTLTAAAVAVFGLATIKAFLAGLALARRGIQDGNLPWTNMPTTFAMLRIWHVPIAPAYAAHLALAVMAAFGVCQVWRSSKDWQLRGATLMAGTFLLSPYIFGYDLAWLAFPIAWLALIGVRKGWMRFEREILLAAWVMPFGMIELARIFSVQLGPLVLALLLWNGVRRARLEFREDCVSPNEVQPILKLCA